MAMKEGLKILRALKKMEAKLMAQVDDLNAKLDEIGTTIDGTAASLATLKTDLDKTLADLAAKIAAGTTATDLTASLAKAQAVVDKLTPITTALTDLDTETVQADA